jgi:hypothetical protein
MQIIIVQFGGYALDTAPLTLEQWGICIAFGFGSLVWNLVVWALPHEWIPNGEHKKASVVPYEVAEVAKPNSPSKQFLVDKRGDSDVKVLDAGGSFNSVP